MASPTTNKVPNAFSRLMEASKHSKKSVKKSSSSKASASASKKESNVSIVVGVSSDDVLDCINENPRAQGQAQAQAHSSCGSEVNKLVALARQRHASVVKMCDHDKASLMSTHPQYAFYPPLAELIMEPSWRDALANEVTKPYFQKTLQDMLAQETKAKKTIYPQPCDTFRALNATPLSAVKAVILGQDPYHGPKQAMGLCFSVPNGVAIPPSLLNMYKEMESDLGAKRPTHGNLERWAAQGVLLLNTVLSVRASEANSHQKRGWEIFTDACIRRVCTYQPEKNINDDDDDDDDVEPSAKRAKVDDDDDDESSKLMTNAVVFLLWGRCAQEKERLVTAARSDGQVKRTLYVLKAPHPSGLSAHRGFFGCKHFSQANALLAKHGESAIAWGDL
ncbi:uracil-DNA glycosylase [Pseudoscourfieldia marina]